MKQISIKSRLILGILAMILIVVVLSVLFISGIIYKQNLNAANDNLAIALANIRNNLEEQQKDLKKNTAQLAIINQMESKIKYLYEDNYNTDHDLLKNTYHEICSSIYNTSIQNYLWKVYIYTISGDLKAYCFQKDNKYIVGYCYKPTQIFQQEVFPGDNLDNTKWVKVDLFDQTWVKYQKTIPKSSHIFYDNIEKQLALISYEPINAMTFNEKTIQMENSIFGLVVGIRKIDHHFVEKMSQLTGTQINVFIGDYLSFGKLDQYKSLNLNKAETDCYSESLNEKICFNIIQTHGNAYFQGVLSLYNENEYIGAIASLKSFAKVKYNTIQILKIMGLVFVVSIILIIPFAIFFSNSLSKPIKQLMETCEIISNGDLDQQIDTSRTDELGMLSKSFESMLKQLKTTFADLKSKTVELVESEKKYRNIFDNAMEGLFQINIEKGRFISVNKSMTDMLGYNSVEDLISSLDVFSTQFFTNLEDINTFKKIIQDEKSIRGLEILFTRKDKRLFWGTISCREVLNKDCKILFYEGSLVNITERYEREKAERAKEAAQTASKIKSEFLANMSHEIRTPMNAIIGLSQLALRTKLTDKQQDYLIKIEAAAETLLGIINDILDFSKIEAGKLGIEAIEFNIEEVLTNLSNLITVKTEEKSIEFLLDVAADVPISLIGDPLRLNQILVNLCTNAVKFTHKGQIIVTIKTIPIKDEDSNDVDLTNSSDIYLHFTVKDTGIGMKPEQLSRLFQSFTQADNSMTRKYGGTGLGLTISKNLVEIMGGRFEVNSEYGKGSEFIFTAKFGIGSKNQDEIVVCPEDIKGMRALVVDDNAASREILNDILSSFSLEVVQAASGQEAIFELKKALHSKPFEIVLMDWKMPELDGIETSKIIKKDSSFDNIPQILMVTAYDQDDVIESAQMAGIKGLLTKPVNRSLLYNSIIDVFHKNKVIKNVHTFSKPEDMEGIDGIRGAKVLLVEDNEINQQIVVELLELAQMHVHIANNGQEAIEILFNSNSESFFDVILMDLQMPVMDGYEATIKIRKKISYDNLPIIALTAHALTSEREKNLQIGMNDYITKPINAHELFKALVRWIKAGERDLPELEAKKQKDTDSFEIPCNIQGINVEEGLGRVAGNKLLYRDLAVQFFNKYQDTQKIIKDYVDNSKYKEAEHLSHSIKGIAGNIGAKELFDTSSALEKYFKENKNKNTDLYIEHFNRFSKSLEIVLSSIQEFFKQPLKKKTQDANPDISLDIGKIAPLLDELAEVIESDMSEAINIMEELESKLSQSEVGELFQKLSEHVNDIDPDSALDCINDIKQQLGIS